MANSGALMSLVSYGQTNKNICTPSHRAGHFTEILLTYNQQLKYMHKLSNNAEDITTFEYIVIDFLNITDHNIDQILNNLGDFVFRVGEVDLIRVRFDLLRKLDSNMKNNKLTIKIPFYAFIKEINMVGLTNIRKYLFIETKDHMQAAQLQINIKVMCYNTYCEGEDRQILHKCPYRVPIQFFYSQDIKSDQPSLNLTHKLGGYSISKGYLFDGNIDQINNIQLKLNDQIYIDYNLDMIDVVCAIISKKILYMPLENNRAYDALYVDDYTHGINNDRIDKLELIINFKTPQTMITVHSININIFTYASMYTKMYLCESDDDSYFMPRTNNYALNNEFLFNDDHWNSINDKTNIMDLINRNNLDYVFDQNLIEIWANHMEHHKLQMISLMGDDNIPVDNTYNNNSDNHDINDNNYADIDDIVIDL